MTPGAQEVGPLRACQHQQVGHHPGHPVELVHHESHLLLSADRLVREQLKVTTDDRDRRPQLVPGVVRELPLHGERPLDAVQHLVEGAREVGDVVRAGSPGSAG